jgi:hypothetical protein
VIGADAGEVVAYLQLEDAVQEVFAVQAVPGRRFPDLINDEALLADSFVFPTVALGAVPDTVRSASPSDRPPTA